MRWITGERRLLRACAEKRQPRSAVIAAYRERYGDRRGKAEIQRQITKAYREVRAKP